MWFHGHVNLDRLPCRHAVTTQPRGARASYYVTGGREEIERACTQQTSSFRAKNSLWPVSVGCDTSLVTSSVFFFFSCKGGHWPFSLHAACLKKSHHGTVFADFRGDWGWSSMICKRTELRNNNQVKLVWRSGVRRKVNAAQAETGSLVIHWEG